MYVNTERFLYKRAGFESEGICLKHKPSNRDKVAFILIDAATTTVV